MSVDYSRRAKDYDSVRADDTTDREFWLRGLVEVGGIRPGERILDLGAGTGRFSQLLSATNPVAAFDSSREMLAVARTKGFFPTVRGDAHRLPFRNDSFDATVVVMVLHHLSDLHAALREVARVSRRVVIATSDMTKRRLGIMEEAFPSLLRIDRARFPAIDEVVRALEAASFVDVHVEERAYHRALTAAQQIDRVRRRYLSTFDLLPSGEFDRGLRFLEVELPRRARGAFEIAATFAFISATT